MDIQLDVTVITKPLCEARDQLLYEVAELESQAAQIEQAAQAEATRVLAKGAEDAAPTRREAAVKKAHAARFNELIAEEERKARQSAQPFAGQAPAAQDGGVER